MSAAVCKRLFVSDTSGGNEPSRISLSHCRIGESIRASTRRNNKLCSRPLQYAPAPCKLTFDLLTLKVVSESRVTWSTSVPLLVFLGLSVLDLGPM